MPSYFDKLRKNTNIKWNQDVKDDSRWGIAQFSQRDPASTYFYVAGAVCLAVFLISLFTSLSSSKGVKSAEIFTLLATILIGITISATMFYNYVVWKERERLSTAWFIFGVAGVFFVIGKVLHEVYYLTSQTMVPAGTFADIPILLSMVFTIVALLYFYIGISKNNRKLSITKLLMDVFLLISAILAICWLFIFQPMYVQFMDGTSAFPLVSLLTEMLYVAWLVGITYLFIVVAGRVQRSEPFLPAIYLIASALITYFFIAITLLASQRTTGNDGNRSWVDIGFNLGLLILYCCSIIIKNSVTVKKEHELEDFFSHFHIPDRLENFLAQTRILAPSVMALVVSGIILTSTILKSASFDAVYITVITLCILTAAASIRQGLTIVENRSLYVQERETVEELSATRDKLQHSIKSEEKLLMEARTETNRANRARMINLAVLDSSKDGIMLVSPTLKVMLVNESFCKLFGAERRNIIGHTLTEYHVVRIFNEALGDSGAFFFQVQNILDEHCEKNIPSLVIQTDEYHELSLYSVPVGDVHNAFIGQLFVFSDVTHEREVERMKTELVSLTSHELRAPLGGITGYIEMVMDEAEEILSDEHKDYLQTAKKSAQRLIDLVNTLLDISTIEAGKIELKVEQIHVQPVIMEVCATFYLMARTKSIHLEIDLPSEPLYVMADRQRIFQILTNLLSNAIKYTPEGGVAYIGAVKNEEAVQFVVRDTGIGLKPEDRQKLFSKFFRADNEETRKQRGTGLGLALTKSLIDLHRGRIWVESEYGKGSAFYFTMHMPAA